MSGADASIHTRRLDDYVSRTVERAAGQQLTAADIRTVGLRWYSIVNQTSEGQRPKVYIYDEIGGSLGVSAEQFAKDLDEIDAPEFEVRINSPGGALFDGISIYNTIAGHRSRAITYVDSLAASIASVIAMAGDEVVMQPGSQLMIHDALAIEIGNAADMERMATFLHRQSDNIASIYQLRAGGEQREWRERMLAETWMFGPEAVELGLADRVARRGEDDPDQPDQGEPEPDLDNLMNRAHSLARFKYPGRDHAPAPARAAAPQPPTKREPDVAAVRAMLRGAFT